MELVIFLIWLALAGAVGYLADSRGRSGGGYFVLAVLLSPLLGFIIVLVLRDLKAVADKEYEQRKEHERQLESIRAITVTAGGNRTSPDVATGSVADELMKLSTLRDKGVLSEEEFQSQKAVVLRRAAPATAAAPPPPVVPPKAAPVPQGICPNCEATIPASSAECPKCKASFGAGSAWAIKPLPR